MVFGLMTNILVTAMLLTGGSAAFNALTGIPTAAVCFLLPLGVIIYTTFGGIKATFLTVSATSSLTCNRTSTDSSLSNTDRKR
jgi:Na+/proline symporter